MPVVMRFGRFRFLIYPHDHLPVHVHVKAAGAEAKFEIETGDCLVVYGFDRKTIKQLSEIVRSNQDLLIEAWHEYQG